MEPKAEVPFSDSLLLSVSVAGFCVLAVTIYKIILAKVAAQSEDENDANADNLSPEEWLVRRANVATLNRGQRRARAKAIMKEQRRAPVQPVPAAAAQDGNEGEGEQQQQQQQQQEPQQAAAVAAAAEEQHHHHHHQQPNLSRKERQAAAKALEREERLRYQSERQRQQRATLQQQQRQKRERRAAEQAARQQAALAEQQKLEEERAARETFLRTDVRTQSVEEFVAGTRVDRVVRLEQVASDFGVAVDVVEERLQQLAREGRLAGYFDDGSSAAAAADDINDGKKNASSTLFVAVSPEELEQMAASIMEKGRVTLSEIATLCEEVMQNSEQQQTSQEQH